MLFSILCDFMLKEKLDLFRVWEGILYMGEIKSQSIIRLWSKMFDVTP